MCRNAMADMADLQLEVGVSDDSENFKPGNGNKKIQQGQGSQAGNVTQLTHMQ